VRLSTEQRFALLKIVTDVDEGKIAVPRVGGAVGRFLRELGTLRAQILQLVPHDGDFVRGSDIGAISLTPLAPLSEHIESDLVGEKASTIAFSEQLAGLVNVTLWAKAGSANRLRNIWLRDDSPVCISGAFRWFAPRRITPGTASVEELAEPSSIWNARCLRYVADDFLAAPAAVSYRWDRSFGPPDFRTFRISAVLRVSSGWAVIPSHQDRLAQPVVIDESISIPRVDPHVSALALALLIRDPWEGRWTVADTKPVDANGVLAHLITWADHRRELLGLSSPDAQEVTALQCVLSSIGRSTSRDEAFSQANLHREVAPVLRRFAAWARRLG
jgi:hypothetical protein